MNRRSRKMGIKKRIAAAIVAAALVVGAAGPVLSAPVQDDASVEAASFEFRGDVSPRGFHFGGSWS